MIVVPFVTNCDSFYDRLLLIATEWQLYNFLDKFVIVKNTNETEYLVKKNPNCDGSVTSSQKIWHLSDGL